MAGSSIDSTLWTNATCTAWYLIADRYVLPGGDHAIHTSSGRQMLVDRNALAPYEITRAEAEAWLKAQLGDVLGELRTNLIDAVRNYFDSRKPSAHESPAELVEHAAAIDTIADWMQRLSPRAATRLQATASKLRYRAETSTTTGDAHD